MELKTTCDNCGNHIEAPLITPGTGFSTGKIVICYVCLAEFRVKDGKLVYVDNTGERE